eukprot:TRINITY_DN6960_c0_g1_i2.p1 TRINITY_DN6960_c0_g1~~TRINITY_DN6960_c0_g1_i2.p1  ORF type:complete len:268 (+),score=51.13 TRINITY_DN6960_c0_g1_i2:428-1231(+)
MVCVKVLKKLGETHSLNDFEAEINFLQRSRHQHLIRFFGAGQFEDESPFLVLELMELGSLDSYLRKREASSVAWSARVSIVRDIASGMTFIHDQLNKLHRDLKTGNVLCTGSSVAPKVKLADFGTIRAQLSGQTVSNGHASILEQPIDDLTLTRGIGTPVYMALEVIRADDYDGKAEVWSFGVMLYEIATHRLPDLLTELPESVVGKKRGGPYLGRVLQLLEAGHRLVLPKPISTDVPSWYANLMEQCMLADPGQRPFFAEICDITA